MKITVKKLQGAECTLEVTPNTLVSQVKAKITEKWGIPVAQQKLLLLGRTLVDDHQVQSYLIKDGTKLNLVVKKPENLQEVAVRYFKLCGMTDIQAKTCANRLLNVIQIKFKRMSWDDINKMCYNCIVEENSDTYYRLLSHVLGSDRNDVVGL